MEKVIVKDGNVRNREGKFFLELSQLIWYWTFFLIKLQIIFISNVRIQLSIIIKWTVIKKTYTKASLVVSTFFSAKECGGR